MFENGKIWMDDAGRSIQAHEVVSFSMTVCGTGMENIRGRRTAPAPQEWMSSASAAILPKI